MVTPAQLNIPKETTWAGKTLFEISSRADVGATDEELVTTLQPPGGLNNIRARRNELVDNGWVVDSGATRPTASGGQATIWVLSPAARVRLWPLFKKADCTLLDRYEHKPGFSDVTTADQKHYADLRERLQLLKIRLISRGVGSLKLNGYVSLANVAGHATGDLWTCIYPEAATDKDDAFEVALILGPKGAEIRFGGGGGTGSASPLLQAMTRLAAAPKDVVDAVEAALGSKWSYRRTWRARGAKDFTTLAEWLEFAAQPGGETASISRDFTPTQLENQDQKIFEAVAELGDAVQPLLEWIYGASGGDAESLIMNRLNWPADRAAELIDLAKRSQQLLFAGPPGTGKTLAALALAEALAGKDRTALVQFHPTYAYEDFVEGIRPNLDQDDDDSVLRYVLRPGIFRKMVGDAIASPQDKHFLVIDEINRANLPKVLGELLFALEYRGPEHTISLPYSGGTLYVPENLWIVGTMNSADRSIALMDAALRRRFVERRFAPEYDVLQVWHDKETSSAVGAKAVERLQKLNEAIADLLDDDRLVGHSYMMRKDLADKGYERVWNEQLEPVLRDHFFNRGEEVDAMREVFFDSP